MHSYDTQYNVHCIQHSTIYNHSLQSHKISVNTWISSQCNIWYANKWRRI